MILPGEGELASQAGAPAVIILGDIMAKAGEKCHTDDSGN